MSVARNILRSYRAPRTVVRELLAQGRRDDRMLACLMGGCALIFVGQWPRLGRLAAEDPSLEGVTWFAGAAFGWLLFAPLIAYVIAGVSHLLARAAGGAGSAYAARVALFWTVLATAPLFMLNGLIAGEVPDGPLAVVGGTVLLVAFLVIWGAGLREAEWGAGRTDAVSKAA